MKKLPITKESFEKSKYFTEKYGKLEYVSESGKLFKTEKGKILKFKESVGSGTYKPYYMELGIKAEFKGVPLKVELYFENGEFNDITVQRGDARYGTDPWVRYTPGAEKLKFGGEWYNGQPEDFYNAAKEDADFIPWLKEILADVESKMNF